LPVVMFAFVTSECWYPGLFPAVTRDHGAGLRMRERARPLNVRDRLNIVCMGGALVGGSALADNRARLPVVAVQVQSVI
jgi:hypothetical protein